MLFAQDVRENGEPEIGEEVDYRQMHSGDIGTGGVEGQAHRIADTSCRPEDRVGRVTASGKEAAPSGRAAWDVRRPGALSARW